VYVCINISGGVATIFYQSCAQIDNNQQVYEAQIQVSRCNSILKAGSHECQKLRPLHLDRCTDHSPKATHLNVCMLSSIWARSCFWIGVSTLTKYFHPSPNISTLTKYFHPHQIFPPLTKYFHPSPNISTPHQIFPHPLFLFTFYSIIIITIFTFILSKVAYIR
jgi:hypothetical protein